MRLSVYSTSIVNVLQCSVVQSILGVRDGWFDRRSSVYYGAPFVQRRHSKSSVEHAAVGGPGVINVGVVYKLSVPIICVLQTRPHVPVTGHPVTCVRVTVSMDLSLWH